MNHRGLRFPMMFLALLLLVLPSPALSNTPTARASMLEGIQELHAAYDAWDPQRFQQAAEIFQQAAEMVPDDYRTHYWHGAALFFLASYYLYAREKDRQSTQGEATVDEGIRVLTRAIAKNQEFSESYALRGVMRGMKIQLNAWTVFSHGPGVEADRNQALKLDPNNPRVHYLTGVSLWMSPAIFGGGGDQALPHFRKALELYAAEAKQEKSPLEPTWGFSTCLSFIGDVYAQQGDQDKAYAYYQKSLAANPRDQRAMDGMKNLGNKNDNNPSH